MPKIKQDTLFSMADNSILIRLDGLKLKYEEIGQKLTDPEVIADVKQFIQLNKEYKELEPIIESSERYRTAFPAKVAAAATNSAHATTTHAMYHTMADIASVEGAYCKPSVSLVSEEFDRTAPLRYLNDHNEAVPFTETGLNADDIELLRRAGITL